MRSLSTVFLGAVGVVALCGFFALTAALGYATSPVAMTATARESDMHGVMLEVVDHALRSELQQGVEPAFEGYVLARVGAAVGAAASEERFYGAVTRVLRDVVHLVTGEAGASGTARPLRPIDLRQVRRELRDSLLAVGRDVRADCARLTHSPACADKVVMEELIRAYEGEVARVTGRIPAEVAVGELAAEGGRDWLSPDSAAMQDARQGYRWIRMARWGVLGLAVLSLLLLAWVNHAPLSRLLTVLGVVGVIAAGINLTVSWCAGDVAAGLVGEARIEEGLMVNDRSRAVAPIVAAGTERLVRQAARDALRASDVAALILLAAGAGSVAGGFLLRRRPRARSR